MGWKLPWSHKQDDEPEQSETQIHEVGSPEWNAQIVGAIQLVNEKLAAQGKRVPEKAAIDIIGKVVSDEW